MSGDPVVPRQMLGDASVGGGLKALDTGRNLNGKPVFTPVRPEPQMQGGTGSEPKLQQS